jgi:hypothetical protein
MQAKNPKHKIAEGKKPAGQFLQAGYFLCHVSRRGIDGRFRFKIR